MQISSFNHITKTITEKWIHTGESDEIRDTEVQAEGAD